MTNNLFPRNNKVLAKAVCKERGIENLASNVAFENIILRAWIVSWFSCIPLTFLAPVGQHEGPGFSSLEAKVDGLRLQQDLLHTLKSRQLLWANHTDDMEIARIHIEIAELIQKTKDQYDRLLERYSLDNPEL